MPYIANVSGVDVDQNFPAGTVAGPWRLRAVGPETREQTDDDGVFSFTGLTPGMYTFHRARLSDSGAVLVEKATEPVAVPADVTVKVPANAVVEIIRIPV